MEAVAHDREPKCGSRIASGTTAVLNSAYLSAERRGQEVAAPLDPTVAE
jgi:hypothetical protein